MATKLQLYSELAARTVDGLTAKRGNWMRFLDTAANLYKYSFPDQLMIHAQRPDATACAEMEIWNKRMGLSVRPRAKGIALIDDSGTKPTLKYVFDVSDTEPSLFTPRAKPLQLWALKQEHKALVLTELAKSYDDVGDSLADTFHNIAKQLAMEYYEDNAREIFYQSENSRLEPDTAYDVDRIPLEEIDDSELRTVFVGKLTDSVAYVLMSRCGMDASAYFSEDDFQHILDFNTPDMVYALGTAVSDLSEQVLRDIEIVIKKYERTHTTERNEQNYDRNSNVHTGRGLSPAEYPIVGAAEGIEGIIGPIRNDEEGISQGTQNDNIQQNVAGRNPVSASEGNGRIGEQSDGTANEHIDASDLTARQVERFDGVDSDDEHTQSTGGGNGGKRTDLQLDDEPPSDTLSQIETSSIAELLSTSSITMDEVDSILRDGGNDSNSVLRITAHFVKNMTPEENADFLRREHLSGRWGHEGEPGGKGYKFNNHSVCMWFDNDGISLAVGVTAKNNMHKVIIPWEAAAARISELMLTGQYISHDVLDEALYNESMERADDVEEVYRNISRSLSDIRYELNKVMNKEQKEATKDDWKDRRYLIRGLTELGDTIEKALNSENGITSDEVMRLYGETFNQGKEIPTEWAFNEMGNVTKERIAELLRDKSENGGYNTILRRFKEDIAALADEPDAPIRFWRNPHRALRNLEKAGLTPTDFPAVEIKNVDFTRFITGDEVDHYLAGGKGSAEGKLDMLSHFLNDHTPKERMDFVKKGYGHGGGTWIGGGSHGADPGKGITLKRPSCEDVKLNWNQATKRTEELIKSGRYATRAVLNQIPSYERIILARQINNFYYNMPEEYKRAFGKNLDFYYPHEAEWQAISDLLDNPERIDAVLEQMQYIFENTSTDDRYYDYRKEGLENLTAFRNGTYTLFPGLENLPTPEMAAKRLERMRYTPNSEQVINLTEPTLGIPVRGEQLSFLEDDFFPVLPNIQEQQAIIEQKFKEEAATEVAASSLSITQDEIDALLLNISDADKKRITIQFTDAPRSREAVALLREIYGGIEETIPRTDGVDGYMGILGESNGIVISKGSSADTPNSPSAETLTLSWTKVVGRISELVEDEAFSKIQDTSISLFEQVQNELLVRGFAVPDELIEFGISEYSQFGDFQDIADNIENDYLTEEESLENDEIEAESAKPLSLYEQYQQAKELAPPDSVVMLPIGSFYEMFGKDAEVAEEHLGLSVLYREAPFSERTKMCGFPEWVLDNNITKLTEAGYTVALATIGEDGNVFINVHEAKEAEPIISESERNTVPTYKVGDTVYLENDTAYEITNIYDISGDVRLLDPTLSYPISRAENKETFEWMLSMYSGNEHLFAPPTAEAETAISAAEPEVEIIKIDFDAVAKTTLERVLNDENFKTDLASAQSRTSLRNPCDSVLERTVRAHEQDEPHIYRAYFYDDNFNDNLFDYILRQSWANRPIPEQVIAETPLQEAAELAPINTSAVNFRITDDHLGEGSAKTKFRYNMDAINLLHDLEFDKRSATPEEQIILSRYVGWGGLPQAFSEGLDGWANEFAELYTALSPEEYKAAQESTLNAHYTSPSVIKAIYEAVERLGFKTGNILEPGCGVGNFFGLLPNSMQQSKLYGVELDSITAQIAKQLYPHADIKAMGFEKTIFPDSFFDLAVGNVPFGSYGVPDKRYDKQNFSIHNYFFAKALDKVRPGGIVAFVTSKFTMDEKSTKVRKYLAERAELLGAVRLPNNAFLKNAGTETTTDIIFLQKRDRPIDIEPEWVHLGLTEDGIPVNSYFIDNSEMILGTMAPDERMNNKYGRDDATTCLPIPDANLAEQLRNAMLNIQGEYNIAELDDLDGVDNHAIPADVDIKNFSYAVVNENVYFRENSLMYPVDLPATTLERIKGMIGLRDCTQHLITLQLDEHSEEEIKAQQAVLNDLYDNFAAEFGLISSNANNRAFNADSSYYLLSSLEILDEDNNLKRKADMFTKRTIKQKTIITHVDTASEALAVSLGEKAYVDLAYMAELTGFSEEKLVEDLHGVIFRDIVCNVDSIDSSGNPTEIYVTADEYLSGNVREKLALALAAEATLPGRFTANVAALEAAQPKDLEASEIAVRLGATWIEPKYVEQFMYELLNASYYNKGIYKIKYHSYTGEWQVTGKGKAQYSDIAATVTYGTTRMSAYQIIDDTLNLRDVRVYDYKEDIDGKKLRVLNKKETMLAQQKQELIKQAFRDWIWADPERRQSLVAKYNELFNSSRPREYDGSHISFSGISPEISLRPHQLNAIAHILYGGNTLLAHEVGAGKTFEMVGAAMESKRLGLCQKSLFAVPNHLTEQWAGEFLRLYPSANILVATKKDFEMRNRKKFCAKIATGDYDAVIIGHSQLEKIPMSFERQKRILDEQIYDIEQGIADLKRTNGERFSIKQLMKTKKSLEVRLTKLLESKKRDNVVTFEQLGVDRLFVDEAHGFKNLFLYTKMRNVAGLSSSEAQKSSDMFMKCRYMDELTGGKGIIFATGTPISNSMTEMYTMQRYLQYDTLVRNNLTHFDSWASIFGETTTSIELAPEGTGYRARTRFAKFHNLPELMAMFKEVADIQTADMLNLPVPTAHYETIIVEPSELQQEMVQELSERAAAVHDRKVDPSVDNMLKITTDGRKIGLDQRLINPLLPDFEGSKVNACTNNVFRIWDETKADRLTQLVFCDFSTPNKDGRFNVYDDMRSKLIANGIPEHEIAFIHDADTETKKKELFAKVRQGKVRVLFGSTFKMGAGTNCQDRLVAIHDADCPWRPADLVQRAGRIVRQGNMNSDVHIFRYATSGTFDSYLWQTVEAKQKFISQIMSSKSPVRSCEDCDETALSYAEIKALCAGNPLIAEKMNLDNEVAKLRMLKSEHQSQRYRLEDNILRHYPEQIVALNGRIDGIGKDITAYTVEKEKCVAVQTSAAGGATVESKFPGMLVNGVHYAEKEPAAKALIDACKGIVDKKTDTNIGEYMGFKMAIKFEGFTEGVKLMLRGHMTYQIDLGTDTFGNITRINNALADLPKMLEKVQTQLADILKQKEAASTELEKPFALETELAEKEARLALLNADLNIDGDGGFDVTNDLEEHDEIDYGGEELDDDCDYASGRAAAIAKSAAPSILDGIRSYSSDKSSIRQNENKKTELDI